ncbi:MAG: hypothetical protein F6J93_31895 [Oscillatoria sp. SIO1A7]|nr:hypothetical protein [Oscillatoria sp. SIO1A7]
MGKLHAIIPNALLSPERPTVKGVRDVRRDDRRLSQKQFIFPERTP